MDCPSCGFENPLETKFCGGCGAPLKNVCSNCGFENPPRFKFCGECGTPLIGQAPPSKATRISGEPYNQGDRGANVIPIVSELKATDAERRQMTVMFCDLVGSTALSEKLDPEDMRQLMQEYQEACAIVIEQFEGYIAKYLGDGLLVYFGYPLAHEDDAQRGVTAGLEIVEAMHGLPLPNTQLRQPLQARIGIHTGLVVVGDMGGGKNRDPMAIVGETPNIAARLQGLAEPNTVVISTATFRMIEGLFECQDLGIQALKGISTPLRLYRVLKESGLQTRIEVAVARGLTPLVGREQEVELLLERWEHAKEGEGQVILLSGEPGIGKSRLVQVLKESISDDPHVQLESHCSPYYQNSSLYPVIDHLQRFLGLSREESSDEKLSKLEKALGEYGFSESEAVPLFASLLSMPIPDRYSGFNLSPQKKKQKTIEAVLDWLLKEAEKLPVFRIFEDLQWVDPSTLEYLSLLIDRLQGERILLLLTFRPDFMPPWSTKSHITGINLNRLTLSNVGKMIDKIAGRKSLPEEIVEQISIKTDGIPLFVEELTKMVLESDMLEEANGRYGLKKPFSTLTIPVTLHDFLMSRLDRLGEVKELVQLCATLGREFTYEVIKAASLLDDNELQKGLYRLVDTELILQKGVPPDSRYFFKHALIQDAAYNSLLKTKRQKYHNMIAEVLESRFPDVVESQPELIAHHLTHAGSRGQGVVYWYKAGLKAIERSAYVEAEEHLKKGLQLLSEIPDKVGLAHQELELLTALGGAVRVTKGFAAPEVEDVYSRAFDLSQKVGETPEVFPVLRGLSGYYIARAEFQKALQLAGQCLRLANATDESALKIQAHYLLGATNFCLGDISTAREHAETGVTLYDPTKHRIHSLIYGQDPGVACLFWEAWAQWFRGYPDQALKKSLKALRLAQELNHPYSMAIAYVLIAFIHQFRGEGKQTEKCAEASITILKEHGFEFFLQMATILSGWAKVKQGRAEEGILQIEQGLDSWRRTGAELFCSYWLAILAESYFKLGKTEEAISTIEEALELSKNNRELYYEAELNRLQGEFLLERAEGGRHKLELNCPPQTVPATEEGESRFRQAIGIARRQSARSLELRAVSSLSHLLKKQNKKEEARQMLSEIRGRFTEGFDTRDLKESKALLEELS